MDRRSSRIVAICLGIAVLVSLAAAVGCDRPGVGDQGVAGSGSGSGKLRVLAAENFWGSIAAQLGGNRVQLSSVIVDPDTDPHSYEPTAQDARTMAGAAMAIVNGIGYDEWAQRLLRANPVDGRVVLDVGEALGLKVGANPHQWYSPRSVHAVVERIVADYDRLRPADAGYFAQRRREFEGLGLGAYDRLRREIRTRYRGVAVGYSESIFQPLGEDLGLRLLTPTSFAAAIAEGGEVSAQDKQTVDRQAQSRAIKVWVFNSQNVTPDVERVNELARAAGIPIATVTETLAPPGASFEQWQVAELEGLRRALHEATGR